MAGRTRVRCNKATDDCCPARRDLVACKCSTYHIKSPRCKPQPGEDCRLCIAWGKVNDDGKEIVLECTCVKR